MRGSIMPYAERYKEPLLTSSFFVSPRSRNIASKFHSAILSSTPSIQTMGPDTIFFPLVGLFGLFRLFG
jgi:hypothetical protein